MKRLLGGLDIGGTKCAVLLAWEDELGQVEIMERVAFPTPTPPQAAIQRMFTEFDLLLQQHDRNLLAAIGVSCGGPLDSKRGIILSPPNLPGWDEIDIITPLKERFGVPCAVMNDANACALAEWKWGAGKGYQNVIFLTMGTGMGGGLILDGRLYSGTNDMAGEVGHIRLDREGPVGFGKAGSFEGFCSGGGIARYAQPLIREHLQARRETLIVDTPADVAAVSARTIAEAANKGDELALAIFAAVGRRLGMGLAYLVDILNPEVIVIGSIYQRQEHLLREPMLEVLEREAISHNYRVVQVVPSGLQDAVGDYAALSIAQYALES